MALSGTNLLEVRLHLLDMTRHVSAVLDYRTRALEKGSQGSPSLHHQHSGLSVSLGIDYSNKTWQF